MWGLGQRPKWCDKYLEIETKLLVNSRKDFYGILEIPHHKNKWSSRQDCYENFEISHQKLKLGQRWLKNPHFTQTQFSSGFYWNSQNFTPEKTRVRQDLNQGDWGLWRDFSEDFFYLYCFLLQHFKKLIFSFKTIEGSNWRPLAPQTDALTIEPWGS